MNKSIKTLIMQSNKDELYCSKFLTIADQKHLLNYSNIILYGGYDNAMLKRAYINFEEDNIVIIKLTWDNKFYDLKHGTIKWYLYSLGYDNDYIGDIVEGDKCFYVVLASEIAKFVIDQIGIVNKVAVNCEIVSDIEVVSNNEILVASVRSLRIDSVIAKTFNISRETAKKLLDKDYVLLNGNIINSYTKFVSDNDVITVIKRGKVKIVEINLNNKTKRYKISFIKFMKKA